MIVSYEFSHFEKDGKHLTEILQILIFFMIFILYRKCSMMC